MTKFRLERIQINTVKDEFFYQFDRDLTVLAGPTGVGKTTLFELIKHGIGGNAHLSPVVESVTDVHLTIQIGDRRLRLSRAVASKPSKTVRVEDLGRGVRLDDHRVDAEPKISDLLMAAMGLPTDARAAASGSSMRAGDLITFNDVFRFMYVSQDVMNRSIAGSDEAPLDLKRRKTFELMFGLVNTEMLAFQSRINIIKGEINEAKKALTIAKDVVKSSGTTSRFDAQIALDKARSEEEQAAQTIELLRNELDDFFDDRTQTLRRLLSEADRDVTHIADTAAALAASRRELEHERHRLSRSRERLLRASSATELIGLIEFAKCPRCSQALNQREVPQDACPVCLQEDPTSLRKKRPAEAEIKRIDDQIEQLAQQLNIITEQTGQVRHTLRKREGLVADLSREIDERTKTVATPRLQRYADAVGQREKARANQQRYEALLRQWDQVQDIADTAERLQQEQTEARARLRELEANAAERRQLLVELLADRFNVVVGHFGIPAAERAKIDPRTYLPTFADKTFAQVSKGGGIITLTQLAYWLAVNTVALEESRNWTDVHYPSFLLMDTPRLALGDQEELADRVYSRFEMDVMSFEKGKAQIIIADNKPPRNMDSRFQMITFDYNDPTIKGIAHPGPAGVKRIPPE